MCLVVGGSPHVWGGIPRMWARCPACFLEGRSQFWVVCTYHILFSKNWFDWGHCQYCHELCTQFIQEPPELANYFKEHLFSILCKTKAITKPRGHRQMELVVVFVSSQLSCEIIRLVFAEEDAYCRCGSSIRIEYRHGSPTVHTHSEARLGNLLEGMGSLGAVEKI